VDAGLALGLAVAALGGLVAVAGMARGRRLAPDIGEFLDDVAAGGTEETDEYRRRLAQPFGVRVVRGVASGLVARVTRLLPREHLETVQKKLLHAGLAETRTATEQVLAQLVLAAVLGGAGVAYAVLARPGGLVAGAAIGFLPVIGLMLPSARLSRKVTERGQAILKDLPDTLDLLAISVEAGLGFEGALDIVCQHFRSPLADEFSLALREMELGLTRREAFQNLKARTGVPELSSFVLALLQADALGIPVGRVLKTQATEMRSQRRQWAREKAAKLPVKMLVPMVLFIFPPILIIVLGPAMFTLTGL
jgi:tight adherence protein C